MLLSRCYLGPGCSCSSYQLAYGDRITVSLRAWRSTTWSQVTLWMQADFSCKTLLGRATESKSPPPRKSSAFKQGSSRHSERLDRPSRYLRCCASLSRTALRSAQPSLGHSTEPGCQSRRERNTPVLRCCRAAESSSVGVADRRARRSAPDERSDDVMAFDHSGHHS